MTDNYAIGFLRVHPLSNIENEYFRLIFCGGTCLAKAHKLVQRMSEDVDFKVQLKINENFSKSRLKNETLWNL